MNFNFSFFKPVERIFLPRVVQYTSEALGSDSGAK